MKNYNKALRKVLTTLVLVGLSASFASYCAGDGARATAQPYYRTTSEGRAKIDFVAYNAKYCKFKTPLTAQHCERSSRDVPSNYPAVLTPTYIKGFVERYPIDVDDKKRVAALWAKAAELHRQNVDALLALESSLFSSPEWRQCDEIVAYLIGKEVQIDWRLEGGARRLQDAAPKDVHFIRHLLTAAVYVEIMFQDALKAAPDKEAFQGALKDVSDRNYEIAAIAMVLFANANPDLEYNADFHLLAMDVRRDETLGKVLSDDYLRKKARPKKR